MLVSRLQASAGGAIYADVDSPLTTHYSPIFQSSVCSLQLFLPHPELVHVRESIRVILLEFMPVV